MPRSAARAYAGLLIILMEQLLDERAEFPFVGGVSQRKLAESREIAFEIADVITLFFARQADAYDALTLLEQQSYSVGQLQLATRVKRSVPYRFENRRREYIARSDREIAPRFASGWLFHEPGDFEDLGVRRGFNNA